MQDSETKAACLEEKNRIMSVLKSLLKQLQFSTCNNGIEVVSNIVALSEEFIKVRFLFCSKLLKKIVLFFDSEFIFFLGTTRTSMSFVSHLQKSRSSGLWKNIFQNLGINA